MSHLSWTGTVPAAGTWILLAHGVTGLRLLRRRRQVIWPLVSMLVLATAYGVAFTPSFRYRIDGIVALVIGSAATLDRHGGECKDGSVALHRSTKDHATERSYAKTTLTTET